MTRSAWPRSLAGQMALLVALALFVAQAINFGLALRDRARFRLDQATRPVAVRLVDALERESGGRAIAPDRGRVRRVVANPITPDMEPHPEVAQALRRQLAEAGVKAGRIETGLAPLRDWPRRPRARAARNEAPGLLIAVEQPGRGWLVTIAPWPSAGGRLLLVLIAQTLVLYGVILLPVLWIARRISRPLRELARVATAYAPGGPPVLVPEEGPHDVRQMIAAHNALTTRASAMLEEKDRMLAAIGHDLRTPLAALRVRVESVDDESDRARMVDTITDMSRTLDDILSLARAGHPTDPVTEVDLAALVDAVVEDFRDLGRDIVLTEASRLPLRLRPAPMRRAVRNLVENAIKYAGAAEVSLAATAQAVTIQVADRGPGIPAARRQDVFDAFTRLETSRNRDTGGIGLGLALTRAIVTEAGGRIELGDRPGGGLLATITLRR